MFSAAFKEQRFLLTKFVIFLDIPLNFRLILRIAENFLVSSNIFVFRPFSYCTFR